MRPSTNSKQLLENPKREKYAGLHLQSTSPIYRTCYFYQILFLHLLRLSLKLVMEDMLPDTHNYAAIDSTIENTRIAAEVLKLFRADAISGLRLIIFMHTDYYREFRIRVTHADRVCRYKYRTT